MSKKVLSVFIVTTLSLSLFAGCGNKEEEHIAKDVQEVVDASTPEPTSTPAATATPRPTQMPIPTPEETEEPDDVEEEADVNEQGVDVSPQQEATTEVASNEMIGNWTDYLPDDYWDFLYEDDNYGESFASTGGTSSAGTNNSSTGSTTSSGGGVNSNSGNINSNTGNSTPSTGNTGNTTASEPSAPAAPAQSAQHTHSYTWVESSTTRVMACSCGETTGRVEDKIADGVWGYWGDASSLLTAVNNQRANGESYGTVDEWGNPNGWVTGLPALDNSLSASAQSIAISAAQGNSYSATGVHAGGSAQDAVSSWVGTGLMSNEKTTSGGVACLNKSNGDGTYTTIWVLVVG